MQDRRKTLCISSRHFTPFHVPSNNKVHRFTLAQNNLIL